MIGIINHLKPQRILTDWRKIGERSVKKEKYGIKLCKHKQKFRSIIKNKFSSSIIKQKKDAIKILRLATRKSSEEFL